jgi:predicted secreted protein
MGIGTSFAVFFLIWWVMLFAVLPFGLRTQEEEKDVTLGTTSSAPSGRHIGRALLINTIVSLVIFGAGYFAAHYLGIGFDSLPRFGPV